MTNIRVIGRNISFLGLDLAVGIVVTFLLFPFMVRHIDKDVYGLYLIVMTLTGYFGIMDLGVMSALTKYTAEYNGRGDKKNIDGIINASFSFYVVIGMIVALLLVICSFQFGRIFKVAPENINTARQLLMIAAVSSLVMWPLGTFRGAIQGLSLWNIDASVNISIQIAYGLAAFAIISMGAGIVQVFLAFQILTVTGRFIIFCIARHRMKFKIVFPYGDARTYRLIFNFSVFMLLSALINIFLFQVHNIIIGYFLSMSAVTIYAVAYNIQNCFRAINSAIGAPPWTIASEMEGRGDIEGQRMLLFKGTRYMSAVFLPVILIMFFYAGAFIRFWMGDGFSESILPARIIILFWLFNGTSELAAGMMSAKAIIRKPLFIQLGSAVFNVLTAVILIKKIGLPGVALGLTLSTALIGFPLILRLALRSLGVTAIRYFDQSIKGNIILYLWVSALSYVGITYLRPGNMFITIVEMGGIYIVSLVLYYFFILKKDDRLDLARLVGLEAIYLRFEPHVKEGN